MTDDQKHNLRHAAVIAAIVISAILHAYATNQPTNQLLQVIEDGLASQFESAADG